MIKKPDGLKVDHRDYGVLCKTCLGWGDKFISEDPKCFDMEDCVNCSATGLEQIPWAEVMKGERDEST